MTTAATSRSTTPDSTAATAGPSAAPGAPASHSVPVPDFKKAMKPFFNPPREPVMVDLPEMGYLMIDGTGAPDEGAEYPTTEFQKSFAALFPVIYTIKFGLKPSGVVVPIMPLEALWFTNPDGSFDMNVPADKWG